MSPSDVAAAVVAESAIRDAAASAALGLGHVEMMPCVDNTHRPWYMLDPNRLLMTTLEQSEALQRKLIEVARQRDAPWSLLVGFDEYTPGNAFRPESSRDCMSLYFLRRACRQFVQQRGLAEPSLRADVRRREG